MEGKCVAGGRGEESGGERREAEVREEERG